MPEWFEALNRDYRNQLLSIGAPTVAYVSGEIVDGKSEFAGGNSGQKVSWQVTGIRRDAWANANRIPVEVDKNVEDRGRYLHPELFGGEAITALEKARDRGRRHHAGQANSFETGRSVLTEPRENATQRPTVRLTLGRAIQRSAGLSPEQQDD